MSNGKKDVKDHRTEGSTPKPPPVIVHLKPLEMRAYGQGDRK
jgi:hypothetical protein